MAAANEEQLKSQTETAEKTVKEQIVNYFQGHIESRDLSLGNSP